MTRQIFLKEKGHDNDKKKTANLILGGSIIFISLFAFDTPLGIGFFIHLIPSFILLALTWLANQKPKLGGNLLLGLLIIFVFFFKFYRQWQSMLFLGLPLGIGGTLFLTSKEDRVKFDRSSLL